MKRRTRVTMYSYPDLDTFLEHTREENYQPGYADKIPYIPKGAKILSIATAPIRPSYLSTMPGGFTLIVTWKEPKIR